MGKRILVVDDEPLIVEALTAYLECEDLEAAGAHDCASATAILASSHYSIVVADLCLHTIEEGLLLIDEVRRLSPGSRIITITLGVVQNVIDYGMSVQRAVDAPRVHHQWLPDAVSLEPGALAPETRAELEKQGYRFTDELRPWGAAETIRVDPESGTLEGANDRRRPAGAAAGW